MADKAKTKDKPEAVKLEGNVQVTSNMSGSTTFEGTTIILGVNSVPAAIAAAMKAHPHYMKLIKDGLLTIHDAPAQTKGKDEDEAIALVKDTHISPLLDEYESEESRPKVVKAIRDKRDELAPTEKKGD